VGAGLSGVIVAATLCWVPTAPPSGAGAEGMRVELLETGASQAESALAAFLRERLHAYPPLQGAQARLSWNTEQQCKLCVEQGGELYACRIFDLGADPVGTKLAAWLFLRSALERATSASDDLAASPPSAVTAPERGDDHLEADGQRAGASAAASASQLRASVGLFVGGQAAGVLSWAGVSLAAEHYRGAAAFGLEAGYAFSQLDAGLRVHHLPVALSVGLATQRPLTLQASLALIADAKRAAIEARSRWALGVAVGPELAAHWPSLNERAALAWRLRLLCDVVRQRYQVGQSSFVEPLWTLGAAVGVEWQ
jgi:hypothetical protein